MKRDVTISALFGLTQQEMAMLLGVGKTHYSMYETGKRDLPLHAKQLLAEMLAQRKALQSKSKPAPAVDEKKFILYLNSLLKENAYQRAKLERAIAAANRKREKAINFAQYSGVLKLAESQQGKLDQVRTDVVRSRASKVLKLDIEMDVAKLELQMELLELEKKLLESKIAKMSQQP